MNRIKSSKAHIPGVGPRDLLIFFRDSFAEPTDDLLLPMKSNTFQTIINGKNIILRMSFILILVFYFI